MTALKVTTIGSDLALVLSTEVIERLGVRDGDEVQVIETPTGAILQYVDAETARQVEIASEVMERRRDALRRLAE